MRNAALFVVALTVLGGSLLAAPATAQSRHDRADRIPLTVGQIAAEDDAHAALIKADLRLTADQEKNWLGFESALRDIRKAQAERQVAQGAERGQRGDVIAYLNNRATFFADRSSEMRKLADAAQPLYLSLDDQQKNRFADNLIRLNRQ